MTRLFGSDIPAAAFRITPSSTQRGGSRALRGSMSCGKYRWSGFSSRLWIRISSPSRKTRARNPSHFGSKIHPSPCGRSLVRLASIGKTGGLTGRRTASTEALRRACTRFRGFGLAVFRLGRRFERVDGLAADRGDVLDRARERESVLPARLARAAHLADGLDRGVVDLFVGGRWIEVEQGSNDPARGEQDSPAAGGRKRFLLPQRFPLAG